MSYLSWSSAALALSLMGCASQPELAEHGPPALANTLWRLVRIQPSPDPISAIKPDDPSRYEMRLSPGGTLALQLDCNRGSGRWTSPAPAAPTATISIGPVAMTRATCRPGSLDSVIARDLSQAKAFAVSGNYLSFAIGPGTYTWIRAG